MNEEEKAVVNILEDIIHDIETRILPNIEQGIDTEAIIGMLANSMDNYTAEAHVKAMSTSMFIEIQFMRAIIRVMHETKAVSIEDPRAFYTLVMAENIKSLKSMMHRIQEKDSTMLVKNSKDCAECPDKETCDSEEQMEMTGDKVWDQATVH